MLNWSPDMTFSVMPGPIFGPAVPPFSLATLLLGFVVVSEGYPAGKAVRVLSSLL
jgi:hypothetical protein